MIGSSVVKAAIRVVESTPGVLRSLQVRPALDHLRHHGPEDLIVIGAGPSLRHTLAHSLGFFDGKRKLCLNEFAHSEYYEKLKPDYYLFTDPAYWRKGQDESMNAMIAKSVDIIKNATTWKMTLFISSVAREWNWFMDLPKQNKNIQIVYFSTNPVNCFRSWQLWFYKTSRAMPPQYNSMGVGIYLGLNMRYRTIFIVGADHNWHEEIYVDRDNHLFWKNPHFTDEGEIELHPMYVDGYKRDTFKMHEILNSLSMSFKGYVELESYSQYLGAKIFNASSRSFIDAFERYKIGPGERVVGAAGVAVAT